jgi:hypothetical protein
VPQKMEALRSPETSVTVYESMPYDIPDDLNLNQYPCESLKSHTVQTKLHNIALFISFCYNAKFGINI